jgi:hypothetical protein
MIKTGTTGTGAWKNDGRGRQLQPAVRHSLQLGSRGGFLPFLAAQSIFPRPPSGPPVHDATGSHQVTTHPRANLQHFTTLVPVTNLKPVAVDSNAVQRKQPAVSRLSVVQDMGCFPRSLRREIGLTHLHTSAHNPGWDATTHAQINMVHIVL